MKTITLPSMLFLFFLQSACRPTGRMPDGGRTEGPRELLPRQAETTQEAKVGNLSLVQSSNRFGQALFNLLSEDIPGGNVFVSPLSISLALTMAYNGAAGKTAEAMQETLGLSGHSLDQLNRGYRDLQDRLTMSDPKVNLEIANSIWYRKGFEVLDDFLEVNQSFFKAVVQGLDFSQAAAPGVINQWVEKATHGKIVKMVDNLQPNLMLLLMNAVYFKGVWTYAFDRKNTRDQPFQVTRDHATTVKMMEMSRGNFSYQETEEFQAADLPYGDRKFCLTVFLPKEGTRLEDLARRLGLQDWKSISDRFEAREGSVWLPRFEVEYEIELNDVLTALGMGIAFTDQADFSKIAKSLAISRVKHKSYVKLDEEGTEAAAVTSVGLRVTSIQPVNRFILRVDRPFLFVVHERTTGTVVFLGKIVNPNA